MLGDESVDYMHGRRNGEEETNRKIVQSGSMKERTQVEIDGEQKGASSFTLEG